MTQAEYDAYNSTLWENYAQERARNLRTPIEEQRAAAAEQHAALLPNGLATPDHYFWTLVDAAGAPVGQLWVKVDTAKHHAFIYAIDVDAVQRGKGYGKQTLEALEVQMRSLSVTRIGLNVFGDNVVAANLYRKMGYQTAATAMQKDI
jgi:ribosomal protein S18 acetylase RimI-like enzyme